MLLSYVRWIVAAPYGMSHIEDAQLWDIVVTWSDCLNCRRECVGMTSKLLMTFRVVARDNMTLIQNCKPSTSFQL